MDLNTFFLGGVENGLFDIVKLLVGALIAGSLLIVFRFPFKKKAESIFREEFAKKRTEIERLEQREKQILLELEARSDRRILDLEKDIEGIRAEMTVLNLKNVALHRHITVLERYIGVLMGQLTARGIPVPPMPEIDNDPVLGTLPGIIEFVSKTIKVEKGLDINEP